MVSGTGPLRLGLPGGKPYDDDANKATNMNCGDGYFFVAHTGLARLRDRASRKWARTDQWAANTLWAIMQRPGWRGVIDLDRGFGEEAQKTFSFTPEPLMRKVATFVFAGFLIRTNATGFVGIMSNVRSTEAGRLKC